MDRASRLDALLRTHDGRPPQSDLRVVLLGGETRANALRRAAALYLHESLAAEARLAVAGRRRTQSAATARADAWLARLAATLAHHRRAAVALRDHRKAYSQ